jgi:hypothetical protein
VTASFQFTTQMPPNADQARSLRTQMSVSLHRLKMTFAANKSSSGSNRTL